LRPTPLELPSSQGDARTAAIQPGSVDMLGPIRLDIAVPRGLSDRADPLARVLDRGTARCSLERR